MLVHVWWPMKLWITPYLFGNVWVWNANKWPPGLPFPRRFLVVSFFAFYSLEHFTLSHVANYYLTYCTLLVTITVHYWLRESEGFSRVGGLHTPLKILRWTLIHADRQSCVTWCSQNSDDRSFCYSLGRKKSRIVYG